MRKMVMICLANDGDFDGDDGGDGDDDDMEETHTTINPFETKTVIYIYICWSRGPASAGSAKASKTRAHILNMLLDCEVCARGAHCARGEDWQLP